MSKQKAPRKHYRMEMPWQAAESFEAYERGIMESDRPLFLIREQRPPTKVGELWFEYRTVTVWTKRRPRVSPKGLEYGVRIAEIDSSDLNPRKRKS